MQLLLSLASFACAGVPMFTFLALIWWLDRYDREPVWLLGVTFLWGAVGAVMISVFTSLLLNGVVAPVVVDLERLSSLDAQAAQAVVDPVLIAPVVEEIAKAAILVLVIWHRNFDNMTDGFVYGAAAGLGFGMTENLLYFVSVSGDAGIWGSTVLIRTFYSAVMHATATAIVGAALGYARFRGLPRLLLSGVFGLALAMLVHGLWNGLITLSGLTSQEAFFTANLVLFPIEVAAVFLVFQVCLLEESWTIRQELAEEATSGLLPPTHPPIMASWLRRLSRAWVPPGVDRDHYVLLATNLAMRKKQVRQMGSRAPAFYRQEVVRLRKALRELLRGRRA